MWSIIMFYYGLFQNNHSAVNFVEIENTSERL